MTQYLEGDEVVTSEVLLGKRAARNEDGKSWLRHSGEAGKIDLALIAGATKMELAKAADCTLGRLNSHITHLRNIHRLTVECDNYKVWRLVLVEYIHADAFADLEAHSDELPDNVTERDAIVKSRIGQGRYREEMIQLWGGCAVTGISNPALLRASHAKPWRDCTNKQRLDPHNGLLLIPNLDHLFDQHLIGFDESGRIRISSALSDSEQKKLGVNDGIKLRNNIPKTQEYLAYHLRSLK